MRLFVTECAVAHCLQRDVRGVPVSLGTDLQGLGGKMWDGAIPRSAW